MKSFLLLSPLFLLGIIPIPSLSPNARSRTMPHFIPAGNPDIQYFGRVDFQFRTMPRFWAPGAYFRTSFLGPSCRIILRDQQLNGQQNYLEIVVDHRVPIRIQTRGRVDTILAARGLGDGIHTITVCKDTESGNGYLDFLGFICDGLVRPPAKPARKIECIGNSITCGFGSDASSVPCQTGKWYDQHNAYESYGAITARILNAQWQLSAVSGIGLVHSCCHMDILMPGVFDKVDMRDDSLIWDFASYVPNVVTICLGQNDGIQDSVLFCSAYVRFLTRIRKHYPKAGIFCLSSPMADPALLAVLKRYLTGVVNFMHSKGDRKVFRFFFPKWYHAGCFGHPDLKQQREMAGELAPYIRKQMHW